MKKHEVLIRPKAAKELKRLPKKDRERLLEALIELSYDPYLGKALAGKFKDYHSLRVGLYRIIYTILKGKTVIVIIRISHRKKAYK